jgi:hypothetical protein
VHGCHFQFYAAQHSVQPTSGSLCDFRQFSEPRQDSVFEPAPHPAHLRLTQTVGRYAGWLFPDDRARPLL